LSLEKILLIDDEQGIRNVLKIILAEGGYSIVCAADGQEGLELFEEEMPSIVITDIKMPGLDGIEVLKAIKERHEETEVIIITGHGEMDLAVRALKLQASDFIHKPISSDAILVAIERALDRIGLRRKLKAYTDDLEKQVQEATRELKRVNTFQANLIQSSIDGIVGTDRTGRIVIFNRSAQRLSQYAEKEVVGKKSLFDLFPPEIARHMKNQVLEKDGPGHLEPILHRNTLLRSRSGKHIPIRLSGALLFEEGQIMGSVWSMEDLQEVTNLEERLIQSERMAAMGETVSGMAHAVKNILGGLKGGTFVVEKGLEHSRDDLIRQGWDMVRRNIIKIQELVMDLLNYAKEREPELTLCDPNEILSDVVDLTLNSAEEYGVQLAMQRGSFSVLPYLDRKWIHRCVMNLVSNAIDACAEPFGLSRQGRVLLKTYEGPSGETCIEVTDNGCGMDEEIRRKLFGSFFSTKGSRGTGLGLMLTQKMVREHGGRIEVESKDGKGSTFKVIFPKPEGLTNGQSIEAVSLDVRASADGSHRRASDK
jgi:two-component system NtrC family sensor kinase